MNIYEIYSDSEESLGKSLGYSATQKNHPWGHTVWFHSEGFMRIDKGILIPIKEHLPKSILYIMHYRDGEIISFCEYSYDKWYKYLLLGKNECPICGHINS